MSTRREFVEDALRGLYSMTELCHRYGISRRVGYKWLDRFLREGPTGLTDRSRRPHESPAALEPALTALLRRPAARIRRGDRARFSRT